MMPDLGGWWAAVGAAYVVISVVTAGLWARYLPGWSEGCVEDWVTVCYLGVLWPVFVVLAIAAGPFILVALVILAIKG